MDITLINPPQVFSRYQTSAGATPPLGVAYLAAFCKENGHGVQVIDALGESPYTITGWRHGTLLRGATFDQILSMMDKDADAVGVSNLYTFAYPAVEELCRQIKEVHDVPIILGGAHPSAVPAETLRSRYIDYVIISEGEQTLVELCGCLESSGSGVEGIDGIGYKTGGRPHVNPKTRFIEDLDALPFPRRDMLPLQNYFDVQEAHGPTKDRWTPIISSRGCPFGCTFCTSRIWNRRWRGRSAGNVVDEIEECVDRYGIKEFHFEDENLTLKKKRTIEMCDEITARGLDISWQTPNGVRAGVTDREMLEKMKESGCRHITVAPESGSERVLRDIMHKRQDIEQVRAVVRHGFEMGMKTAAYFILGLPGETREDVEETIAAARLLAKEGLDEVVFGLFIPLPGSELYDQLFEAGRGPRDYEELIVIGDLAKTISWSEHITNEELAKLRRKAYIGFHISRLRYHPLNTLRSLFNILRGVEETKTERTIRTFIRRSAAGLGLSRQRRA